MLTEIKNEYEQYFADEQGRAQGEYKAWHSSGQQRTHCFFKDDVLHGEYKSWYTTGVLAHHNFVCNNNEITDEVKALVEDILNLTAEERLLIKLTWGIECLPR